MFAQNDLSTPNASPAVSSSATADGLAVFKKDIKRFLNGVVSGDETCTGEMLTYLYSAIVPPGQKESGADLWDKVISLGSDQYYIPRAEGRIIDRNADFLGTIFDARPTMVDLGPGGFYSLELKSLPTAKYTNAATYLAFDINEAFAVNAADIVRRKISGIKTAYHIGDFSKPDILKVDTPVLLTMYGCTLSQFPFAGTARSGEITFQNLMQNLGNMVDYNAIMIATIDTNGHGPSAQDCYVGQHMSRFQTHLWSTIKTLVEYDPDRKNNYVIVDSNPAIDPAEAVLYHPLPTPYGITHSYVPFEDIRVAVDGEVFVINKGTRMSTGFSERWSVDSVESALKGTGWSLVRDLADDKSTIHALVLAGKNVSRAQLKRAKGQFMYHRGMTGQNSGASGASSTAQKRLAAQGRLVRRPVSGAQVAACGE